MKAGEREELTLLACCCCGWGWGLGVRSLAGGPRPLKSQEAENTRFRFNSSGVPGGHLENYTRTLVSDPTNRVHVKLWGPPTQVEEPQVGTGTSQTRISSRKEEGGGGSARGSGLPHNMHQRAAAQHGPAVNTERRRGSGPSG